MQTAKLDANKNVFSSALSVNALMKKSGLGESQIVTYEHSYGGWSGTNDLIRAIYVVGLCPHTLVSSSYRFALGSSTNELNQISILIMQSFYDPKGRI